MLSSAVVARDVGPPSAPVSGVALVVEDDADLRLLARLRLVKLGWTVLEAASLEEAKERLVTRDDVDAVLLDLRLGPVDGVELLDWLSESGRGSRPGVVVVSATADPAAVARSLDHGARAYVQKPYTAAELAEALELATAT
jgi:CheY-like chemotaxis protein